MIVCPLSTGGDNKPRNSAEAGKRLACLQVNMNVNVQDYKDTHNLLQKLTVNEVYLFVFVCLQENTQGTLTHACFILLLEPFYIFYQFYFTFSIFHIIYALPQNCLKLLYSLPYFKIPDI